MNSNTPRTLQTVVLSLIVVGLIALALSGYLSPLTRAALNPVVAAQTWLATRFQAIQAYFNAPEDLTRLQQRNAELEAEVARLQGEIVELKGQISELPILEALVNFERAHPENDYLAAEVIGRDTSPFIQYILINRGSDDGIRRGMPVVTSQGLVGRIAAVAPGAARVQLITDADARVNVRLQASRIQAMLTGSVTGEINLDMIPQAVEITPGDLVLTSGLGGNFPPDVVIGQVTAIRSRDTDLFQRASVQPVVDFSQLEIVLIITNFRPVDVSPLIPTPSTP